jgi:TonB family protein
VLFISTVGFAWHAKHVAARNAHGSNLPSAAWSGSKQPAANPVAPASAPQPTGAAAAKSISGSKSPGSKAAGVSVSPPSRLADVKVADANKSTATDSSTAVGGTNGVASDHAAAERRRHAATSGSAVGEITPPQIVSGPQPTYPTWAEGIDADPVVLLEATIDENGKLTHTRVLSGPRALQREAQKAVALWIFDPATKPDGTPVATHMVLTVEFQR